MPSTPTTSDRRSISSEPSSTPNSSHATRHENSVPRNTSDLTSPTKTNLLLPSQRKSWHKYERSSQTSRQQHCPRMHYHLYCDSCQTLMGWEPHRLTKPTPKCLITSFGKLKEYCESLPAWEEWKGQSPKKVSIVTPRLALSCDVRSSL